MSIRLSGAVRIWKQGLEDKPQLEIETHDMRILLDQDYAETDSRVVIRTASGETRSVGMHAYFKQHRVELLSQVRSQYEPSKTF